MDHGDRIATERVAREDVDLGESHAPNPTSPARRCTSRCPVGNNARMRPQVIAHRGASDENAEHTLGAYLKALAAGAEGLECDVRLTADGHLVCVHDRDLRRTASTRGIVSTMELADLDQLDFSSWKNPWADLDDEADDEDVALGKVLTLRKLLETVADYDRRVELAIETKHPTRYAGLVERRLIELLREFGWDKANAPVRIMSFSLTALQRANRLAPELEYVMLRGQGPALADAQAGGGAELDHRPGHRRADGPPRTGPAAAEGQQADPRVDGQHRRAVADLPRPRRGGCDHRPPGVPARPSSAYRFPSMGKRSRTKTRDSAAKDFEGQVGPRQPCPCGSGRRYKACHGDPSGAAQAFVGRPFEGLPSECDVIALRELVPAATAPLALSDDDRRVTLCSLLPGAAPALVRENGEIWLGLQVQHNFGDPARDLGAVLAQGAGHRGAGCGRPHRTSGCGTATPGPGHR